MKTLCLILILFSQPTAKQYRIIQACEGRQCELINGAMAITKQHVYLKLDTTVFTFDIDTMVVFNNKDFYFLGKDTIVNNEVYAIYRGVCRVDNELKSILMEARNARYGRTVMYKFK